MDEESRALSEPSRLETDALKRAAAEDGAGFRVRLACQTKVLADVVVRRMGVHLMRPAGSDAKQLQIAAAISSAVAASLAGGSKSLGYSR